MPTLRLMLLLLLACGQVAHAYPKGEWVADFDGALGIIILDDSIFSFQLDDQGEVSGFAGPLVEVKEAEGLQPGRLIVGPVEDGEFPYEVVWFFATDPPRARFAAEPQGYRTLSEARAGGKKPGAADASLFMTPEFFKQVDALPPLPVPSRQELIALLEEALRRQRANPEGDTSSLMETLMIDRGFHPRQSRQPFEQALQQYSDDPEVDRLLEGLEQP